jgi:hypothetical protein
VRPNRTWPLPGHAAYEAYHATLDLDGLRAAITADVPEAGT